jgi:hypothetical protein
VPKGIQFQTEPEIALGLLDEADPWGVKYACAVGDADYGDNPIVRVTASSNARPENGLGR